MSQYDTRLLVKVKNVEDWKSLKDLDLMPYGILNGFFDDITETSIYIMGGEWSCNESGLIELVSKIAELLPTCIVLSDTHNYNVDPYNYCVYYFNDKQETMYVDGEESWEVEVTDMDDWFAANEIEFTDDDKIFLENF